MIQEKRTRRIFNASFSTLSALPRVANGAGAGIGRGVGGDLAVELCKQRNAVGEAKLGAGGVSAEFFAGVAPLTTKLAPGSVWNAPEAETLTCSWRR